MKQVMKTALGIVVGSLATSAITLVAYKPIMNYVFKINMDMLGELEEDED